MIDIDSNYVFASRALEKLEGMKDQVETESRMMATILDPFWNKHLTEFERALMGNRLREQIQPLNLNRIQNRPWTIRAQFISRETDEVLDRFFRNRTNRKFNYEELTRLRAKRTLIID